MIEIKEDFKKLIPALTTEEFRQLENNCLAEGIREEIITWNGFIIDGHNRYEIATRWGLDYETESKRFNSESDVREWMINNQFGRRNLSNYQRSVLALELESVFKEKAKERQGTRTDIKQTSAESIIPPIETRKELAKVASVSHDTIAKVKVIQSVATPEIKEKLNTGEISINQAYQEIKKEELQQKAANLKAEQIELSKNTPIVDNIILGNSIEETLNAPNNIKCVLTDPPYGMQFISNRRTATAKDSGIKNDDTIENAVDITKQVYINLYSKMADDSVLFSFIGWKQERFFMSMIEEVGFTIKNSIIWVKNNHGSGDLTGSFSPKHERIIFAVKGSPKLNFRPEDVLNGSEIVTEHPTSKPIDLLEILIKATTNEGDIIADPFAGHGSTGIAASRLKRNYWLCELDEYNHSQINKNILEHGN